jgi:hypothetical protein
MVSAVTRSPWILAAAFGLLAGGVAIALHASPRGPLDVTSPLRPGDPNAPPEPRLHDTGLYAVDGTIRPDHVPFAPQYPLWTDGAGKRRWIYVPPGSAIDASRPDAWRFPIGTRLWKEFSLHGRPIETRMIERLADGSWRFATYAWDAAGAEATLVPPGGGLAAIEVAPGRPYQIPGAADCRACHDGEAPVLGFSALQLSPDRDPLAPHAAPPPPGAVDLDDVVARGLVRGWPERLRHSPPRIPGAPIERAALGYLHANCGHCHRDDGALPGLDLALAHALDADPAALPNALRTTINRVGRFTTRDGATVRVVPGRPDRSVLLARARARDPLSQMPPIGTQIVDHDGLAVLEAWITQTKED